MRICAVMVALVSGFVSVRADDAAPPPIADAIKSAAEARKPLLLEFHAEWCVPCKQFAEKTLPDSRVQSALEDVVFVRYDGEAGPGIEAAKKYNVYSYPTFVVIDKQGIERHRQEGAPVGEPGVRAVIELVATARVAVMDERDVRVAISRAPHDANVRLTAAKWFVSRKMRRDAMVQYEAVSTNNSATSAQRAEAITALVRMRRLTQWKQQLLGEKIALVEAIPAHADPDDVALVTLGSDMAAADKRKLIKRLLEAQSDTRKLNSLVYVALANGATEDALAAAKRVVAGARTAAHLDTLAECYFISGNRKQALELQDEALKLAKGTPIEAQLRHNRDRFERGSGQSTEVRRLPLRVRELWKHMDHVDQLPDHVADGFDSYMRAEFAKINAFREATQDLERVISKACTKDAGAVQQAMARLDVTGDGRIRSSVLLLESNTPNALRDCLTNQLGAARLPKYKPWERTVLAFDFAQ